MNFTQRLKLNSYVSLGVMVVMIPVLVWSLARATAVKHDDDLADDIMQKVSERISYRDEYLIYQEEASKTKWLAATKKTSLLLQQAAVQFSDGAELLLLGEMRQNFDDTVIIFSRILELTEKSKRAEATTDFHNSALEKQLYSQLLQRAATLQNATIRLQRLTETGLAQANERSILITTLFVFLVAMTTIINALFLNRTLRQRLTSLHSGARTIASGNLGFRINDSGSDELADLAGTINSMTERVQCYTRELQQSHDLLDVLSRQVPGVIYQYQLFPDGRSCFPYASEAITWIYEVSPDEVRTDASAVFAILHPDDYEGVFNSIRKSAETLQPWEYEYQVVLPRQGTRWRGGIAHPEKLSDGSILWNGIITDITDRKRLERDIKMFNDSIDKAFDAVQWITSDARILYANETACHMLGYTRNELIQLSVGDIDPVFPMDTFSTHWAKSKNEHGVKFETVHRTKDGREFPVEIAVSYHLYGEREINCCIIRDIGERKQAELKLAEAREMLETQVLERTFSLSRAIGLLSLEIEERKKMEQDLLNYQQKLESMALDLTMAEERVRDRIAGELHDQVGQRLILGKMKLGALANQAPTESCLKDVEELDRIIDLSIQDIRSLTFQLRPPLLASAGLEAALHWLGEEFRENHGLQISYYNDDQPKPMRYEFRSTVFQAAREMMLNTVKHAGATHIGIRIVRDASMLIVTISDNGCGFNSVQMINKKTKLGGFGLINVQRRIEHLGGSIIIASNPDSGTCTTITAPLDIDIFNEDQRGAP